MRRRGRDRAQNLRRRGLVLQRLPQLPRPLLDFALQARVGLAQLRRHTVELVRQRLQFIAAVDVNALVQFTGRNARRAGLQHADGADHAPRQDEAGQKSHGHAREEQDARANDQGIQGRKRLACRLFDEDNEARWVNSREGREHVIAVQAPPLAGTLMSSPRPSRAGPPAPPYAAVTRLTSGCAISCRRRQSRTPCRFGRR